MKYFILSILVCIGLFNFLQERNRNVDGTLFLIKENNRFGFINSEGKAVIKSTYRSAGEFSEGLANVRIDGTHGYINKFGEIVIAPQFDYATPFKWGIAKVYKDGIPIFINKKGE